MPALIQRSSSRIALLALAALTISLLVLHRWVVTPLGLESFGRVWYLFVSYTDFGFTRRSLEGTVVQLSGLPRLFHGPYQFGFFWQSVKLIVLTALAALMLHRRFPVNQWLFKAAVLLSPALLMHFGYETGSPDLTLVIVAFITLYKPVRPAFFVLLLCVGVLIHELFAFLVPCLALTYVFQERGGEITIEDFLRAAQFAAPAAVLVGLMLYLSRHAPVQAVFESRMAELLGPAAHRHAFWSGYFELFAGVHDNISVTRSTLRGVFTQWKFTGVPLLYTGSLALAVFVSSTRHGRLAAGALATSVLLPVGITYVATDFYRWVSLSCTMSLLVLACMLPSQAPDTRRRLNLGFALLLLLTPLGPLGAYPLERPFPLTAFVFERLGSSAR